MALPFTVLLFFVTRASPASASGSLTRELRTRLPVEYSAVPITSNPTKLALTDAPSVSFSNTPSEYSTDRPSITSSSGGSSTQPSIIQDDGCQNVVLAEDDFEHGLDGEWECGTIAHHEDFSNFGTNPAIDELISQAPITVDEIYYGGEGCDLARFFHVSPIAENVELEFISYSWCTCGNMEVVVCNTTIDVDRNMHRGVPGGTRNDIVWKRENVSTPHLPSDHPDRVQRIKISFPKRCYSSTGGLHVSFPFRNIGGVDNHIGGIDNVTLRADICAPTPVPNYPTRAPTPAPTPPKPAAACLDVEDGSRKECHGIVTETDFIVGSMCLEVGRESTAVTATFEAYGDWRFQTQHLWMGSDHMTDSPKTLFGDPDENEFPYYWNDPEGATVIHEFFPTLCGNLTKDQSYYEQGIAQLQVFRVDSGGSKVLGSETTAFANEHSAYTIGLNGWYGWFDLSVDCGCESPSPTTSSPSTLPPTESMAPSYAPPTPGPTSGTTPGPTRVPTPGPTLDPTNAPTPRPTLSPTYLPTPGPTQVPTPGPSLVPTNVPTPGPTQGPIPSTSFSPTTPKVCIESDTEINKECYSILLGKSSDTLAGKMCLEADGNGQFIIADFSSFGSWHFQKIDMWIGSKIEDVPKTSSGGLDTSSFPYHWANHQGENAVTLVISPGCEGMEQAYFTANAAVQVELQQSDPNGSPVDGSSTIAFVQEFWSGAGSESQFGWLDFLVNCMCQSREPSPWMTLSPSIELGETLEPTGTGHKACIESVTGEHRDCQTIETKDGMAIGELCLEVDNTSGHISAEFTAFGRWRFLDVHAWIGNNMEDAPTASAEDLDCSNFPYTWSSSEGSSKVTQVFPVFCTDGCPAYTGIAIAHVEAQQIVPDGSPTKTDGFVQKYYVQKTGIPWFDYEVNCECLNETLSITPTTISQTPTPALDQSGQRFSTEPSLSPSFGPSYSAETSSSDSLAVCIEAENDSRRECNSLITNDDMLVGSMCLEATADSSLLRVEFHTFGNWKISLLHMWVGCSCEGPPTLADGSPDTDTFPYVWRDDEGKSFFTYHLSWRCSNDQFGSYTDRGIAQLEVFEAKEGDQGSQESTKLLAYAQEFSREIKGFGRFGWFEFDVNCNCFDEAPTSFTLNPSVVYPSISPAKAQTFLPTAFTGRPTLAMASIPTTASSASQTTLEPTFAVGHTSTPTAAIYPTEVPKVCIVTADNSRKECIGVLTVNGTKVGTMCLQVKEPSTDISVETQGIGNWRIQSQRMWIGSNIANVPRGATGSLDVEAFPYWWRAEQSLPVVVQRIASRCREDVKATVAEEGVAQVVVQKTFPDGSPASESGLTAYAEEYRILESGLIEPLVWFQFQVNCNCSGLDTATSVSAYPTTAPTASSYEAPTTTQSSKPTTSENSPAYTTTRPTTELPELSSSIPAEIPTYAITTSPADAATEIEHPSTTSRADGPSLPPYEISKLPTARPIVFSTSFPSTAPSFASSTSGSPSNTAFPTLTPTLASSRASDECTRLGGGKQQKCVPILTASGVTVGEACIRIIHDPDVVDVNFSALPGWAFVEQVLWLGENIQSVSQNDDGLAYSMFPYLSRNSTGSPNWSSRASVKCQRLASPSYMQYGVSEVDVWRQHSNGTLFGGKITASVTEFFESFPGNKGSYSYFSFQVDCLCNAAQSRQPTAAPTDLTQSCPKSEIAPTCHSLSSKDGAVVGEICVVPDEDPGAFRVEISALEYWTLLEHQVWVGSSLDEAPTMDDNSLDFEAFPYSWCDSRGVPSWNITVRSACKDQGKDKHINVFIVARSKAAQTQFETDGIMPETDSFAFDLSEGSWFGFSFDCACGKPAQTSPPTIANLPSPSPSPCPARIVVLGKLVETLCKPLATNDGNKVGEVCVEQSSDGGGVEVSFTAADYWTFLRHYMWVGDSFADPPRLSDGGLRFESFPYRFFDSKVWNTTLKSPCQNNLPHSTISLVSQSEVIQTYPLNEDRVPDTQESAFIDDNRANIWYGRFDFDVHCTCESLESLPPTIPVQPVPPTGGGTIPSHSQDKACIEPGISEDRSDGRECHPISLGANGMEVGLICAEIIDHPSSSQLVEVTLKTYGGWVFVKNHLWIDTDISRIPKLTDGSPDAANFPFVWVNSTGSNEWKAHSSLKCHQNQGVTYELIALVHSLVIPSEQNQSTDALQLAAFGVEHRATAGGLENGWLDFTVNCRCPSEDPTGPVIEPPNSTQHSCLNEGASPEGPSCQDLESLQGFTVGSICAERAATPVGVDLEIKAENHWTFISHKLWTGFDLDDLPLDSQGRLDYNAFSETRSSNRSILCPNNLTGSQQLYYASRSIAQQTFNNGTVVGNSDVVVISHAPHQGRHHMPFLEVDCGIDDPGSKPCQEFMIHFQGDACSEQVIPLLGPCRQESVGSIVLRLTRHPPFNISVEFRSSSPLHPFVSTALWLGRDLSEMPGLVSGVPDIVAFPFSASRSGGLNSTIFEQPLNLDCETQGSFKFVGVAHSISKEFSPSGEPISGSDIESFGYLHDGYSSNQWFGYFDVAVECTCARDLRH